MLLIVNDFVESMGVKKALDKSIKFKRLRSTSKLIIGRRGGLKLRLIKTCSGVAYLK
jgi:hypothetical protein